MRSAPTFSLAAAWLVGLLAGCAGMPPPAAPVTSSAALTVPAGYALVWSDEFDRDGLPDPARWVHDTGMNKAGWHNREQQYNSHPGEGNAEQRDGLLLITARREGRPAAADWGGQPYTSARLITSGKAEWTYGFFEIRARLPCGGGTWPAIWMLGSRGDWPAGGELDILEHVGHQPDRVFSTVHTAAGSGGQGAGAARSLPGACSDFHRYQMHWTPQAIRFGVDDQVHFVYPNPGTGPARWPFDAPQFLIINLAIGGDLGGEVDDRIFPRQLAIDHVRVYQRRP